MIRLPIPGSDDGSWGKILNDFLAVEHSDDGSLKPSGSLGTKYTLPSGGIPRGDLAPSIRTSLDNADAAVAGTIADNSITDIKVSTTAGIAQSKIAGLTSSLSGKEPVITSGTTGQYLSGNKTFQTLDKAAVGLTNIDNTTDLNKPISVATQTALNAKASTNNVLIKTSNLQDLGDIPTARTNLGLGTAALKDVPASGDATSTQVVLGNDSRLGSSGSSFTSSRHLTLTVPALSATTTWHSVAYDGLPAYFVGQSVSATIAADHDGSLFFETSPDATTWTTTATTATSAGAGTVSGTGNVTYFRISFTCGSTSLTGSATVTVTISLSTPS